MNVVRRTMPGGAVHEIKFDVFAARLAAHQLEHARMNVLQRHVDVARDLFGSGDRLDEFIAPMRGMRVEEPNPELAFDRVEFAQQFGQRGAA